MNGTTASFIQFETVELVDKYSSPLEPQVRESLSEAQNYLMSFAWVNEIKQSYVGDFFEGIVGIFLFQISPRIVGVDDFVWVIIGDLHAAYITVENCPNPAAALDGFIGAMEEWVSAVENAQPTESLVPVNVPADSEHAAALKTRLNFLDAKILPLCKGSLSDDLRQ
jgi:hypothetical protein